jgi:hypothetical protein
VSRSVGRGNGAAFAASIQRMQQTQGNRALQRVAAGTGLSNGAATRVLQAAADILENGTTRLVAGADPGYQGALRTLAAAQAGKKDGLDVGADDRLHLLDSALSGLQPAFAAAGKDAHQQEWVTFYVTRHVEQLRTQLNLAKARDRVDQATIGPQGIAEGPSTPQAEAVQLRAAITKQIKTCMTLNDMVMKFKDHGIDEGIKAMQQGHLPPQIKHAWTDPSVLLEIQNVLMVADGFLTLTDAEFHKKLNHIQGFFNGVATYADLVKAVGELVGGTLGVSASFAAVVAKAAGQTELIGPALGLARGAGNMVGNVLSGVEIVHGMAVVMDSSSTPDEKVEGMKDVIVGGAWFVGKRYAGAAMGAGASFALLVTYYEMQYMAQMYGQARTGITGGWMSRAFMTMDQAAMGIAERAETLAKAGLLAAREQDPAQQAALKQVEEESAQQLGRSIDSFLDACQPVGYGPGAAYKPGAFAVLRRQFDPLQAMRGATTPEAAAQAALAVLEKLRWCQEHQQDLILEESGFPSKAKAAAAGEPATAG